MKDKKRVCFACFTIPNIFTSYLLSKTVYKDYYKILLLSDWNCKEVYLSITRKCQDLWDEVFLFNEAGKKDRSKRLEEIKLQLNQLDFTEINTLHYFQMNQNSYLNLLFYYLSDQTKVIITIYTAATYYIKEYFQHAKEVYNKRNEVIHLDLNRISEIWVYDKRLYIGDLSNILIQEINIETIIKNKELLDDFCDELNKIFNYNHLPIDCDVIFLDQAVKRFFKKEEEEKELFSNIMKEFYAYKVLVKLHPSVNTVLDKYDHLNVRVIKENKVPWEVILLNEVKNNNLENKIFVSYYSETLFTTHIFLNQLNIPHEALHLKGLLQRYKTINREIGELMFDRFIDNFKKVYADNFHDLKSFHELRKTLKSFTFNLNN